MLGFVGVAGQESLAGLFLKFVTAGKKLKEIYSMVLINENKFVKIHGSYRFCLLLMERMNGVAGRESLAGLFLKIVNAEFHAFCVDSWLTTWRTFCPVCKRDARTSTGDPPASESTPLLSSTLSTMSSSALSSVRSSLASSSAIQIAPAVSRSPSVAHTHSLASNPYIQQSLRSYRQSPMSFSRSSVDLRNASSQRSRASHLVSPASLNYPSISPLNARYISPYFPSPSNASPSIVSSSGHPLHPLHYSESAASFSPFASAQSLPDC
ncbi:hypothetical protein Godav_015663 [Gossypium davidsonii]|uniref:RING-type domain-containing protein n=1 Tax=Gossypium davidsonii TaxID=34287 RepID=A0A7J8RNV0_GOSDV|nr:hypothetical protein [Gossypium davidsonii]